MKGKRKSRRKVLIKKKSHERRKTKIYDIDNDFDKRIYELKIGIETELKKREKHAIEQREKEREKELMEQREKQIKEREQLEQEAKKRSFIEGYIKKIDNSYNKLLKKNDETLKEVQEKKSKEANEKAKEMQKLENEKSKLIRDKISDFNKVVGDSYLLESKMNKNFGSYCSKNIECKSQNCSLIIKPTTGLQIRKIYNNVLKNAIITNVNETLNSVDIKYIDKDISGLV